MGRSPTDKLVPIRAAVQAWVDAADAVMQDAFRIAKGGLLAPPLLAGLNAAVEIARQRCEDEMLRVLAS